MATLRAYAKGDGTRAYRERLHECAYGDDRCVICGYRNWRRVKKGVCERCAEEFPVKQHKEADNGRD